MKNSFWSKVGNVMFGDDYFSGNLFAAMLVTLVACGITAKMVGRTYEADVIETKYVNAKVISLSPPKHVIAYCIDEDGVKFEVSLGKWCDGSEDIPSGTPFRVRRQLNKYIRRDEPNFWTYDGEGPIENLIKH